MVNDGILVKVYEIIPIELGSISPQRTPGALFSVLIYLQCRGNKKTSSVSENPLLKDLFLFQLSEIQDLNKRQPDETMPSSFTQHFVVKKKYSSILLLLSELKKRVKFLLVQQWKIPTKTKKTTGTCRSKSALAVSNSWKVGA